MTQQIFLSRVQQEFAAECAFPLYLAQYIEEIGSGTTDMIRRCGEAGLPAPKFEATSTEFLVTVYRPAKDSSASGPVEKAVAKAVAKILLAIRDNPRTPQKQLMEITGLTRRGIEWNLKKLKETGRIVRVGPDKGGHWKIMPETAAGDANGDE